MAEAKSPIICVTCTRPFSDDLKADDAPRYFAQGPLLPKTDDAYDFKCEVQRRGGRDAQQKPGLRISQGSPE